MCVLWMVSGTMYISSMGPWNIYVHEWLKFMVNVGKCSIHGAYGYRRCELDMICLFCGDLEVRMIKHYMIILYII